jgi:hypothetical protein
MVVTSGIERAIQHFHAIRDKLDPVLDACVADYRERLDEAGQVDVKGQAKAFLRTYGFLSSILPYTNAEREQLSIFLTLLVPKLPAPVEEDLSKGIQPGSRTSFFDWFAHDTRQLDRERFD